MVKKRYHVVRKQQADLRALFRGLVSAYLLYLAFRLATDSGSELPPLVRVLICILFLAGGALFGLFAWKQYRTALKEAELTPAEEEALHQEREP